MGNMENMRRTSSRLSCVEDADLITRVGQRAVWAGTATFAYTGLHGIITEYQPTDNFIFIAFKPDGMDVKIHGFHDTAFPEENEFYVQAIREYVARKVTES